MAGRGRRLVGKTMEMAPPPPKKPRKARRRQLGGGGVVGDDKVSKRLGSKAAATELAKAEEESARLLDWSEDEWNAWKACPR